MIDDDALGEYVRATARLQMYGHRDREVIWTQRLKLNADELRRMPHLADAENDPIQRICRKSAHIPLPEHAPSVVAARGLRQSEENATSSVNEARTRARAAAESHNVFTYVSDDRALPQRIQEGPLAGIPIAVKDLVAVAGFPMTGGTRALAPGLQTEDAEAIRRLRASGAVPIGLTNLHELAYGITSDNPHFGRVRNPHAPERIAGGSSGGAAAAVALGVVPISIGTDTAGSIRIPAACCGVVGMKPSYDLVSRKGAMPLAWSLDHIGPLATNVADIQAALSIMSDHGSDAEWGFASQTIRLVRPANFFFDVLEPSVRAGIEQAITALSRAGIDIVERGIAGIENAAAAQYATIAPEAAQANRMRFENAPSGLGEDVRTRLEAGRFILAADYVAAQRFRSTLNAAMLDALDGCDAFITPTIAIGAPPAGLQHIRIGDLDLPIHAAMTRCTAPFNLTGMPAITLPCGVDRDGLPIGLQIAGRRGEDARVLKIAAIVEAELVRVCR